MAVSFQVLLKGNKPFELQEFFEAQKLLVEWWTIWLNEFLRLFDLETNSEIRSRLLPAGEGIQISILTNPQGFQYHSPNSNNNFFADIFPQHFNYKTAYFCLVRSYLPTREGSGVYIFTETADFVKIPRPSMLDGPSQLILLRNERPKKSANQYIERIRLSGDLLLKLEQAINNTFAN